MNEQDYQILVSTSASRNAPPPFAVKLLEDTCQATGLDWKRRHVYLMERGGKWGVTLSIDGFRMIAAQSEEYGGQEGPFWVAQGSEVWTDIPPDGPIYASKVGVRTKTGAITWGVAKFKDYAAGPMWTKFPSTMIAKCAEMLALRKAMPGKLGGLYGLEEMAQADKAARSVLEAGEKAEVRQTSKERVQGFDAAVNAETDFLVALSTAPNLETLKEIGAKISKADLKMDIKMDLHKKYSQRKAELGV